ncbi:MAG: hypothetical protein ACOX6T_23565 [Myxococcales bacterium]|jgi:hypothetical protein
MREESALTPFNGRFRLLGRDGAELEASDAVFEPGPEALLVQPQAGAPLRVEFADVDGLASADYVSTLVLESGERIEASMLGRRFGEYADALGASLRDYQAKNLLLEEPSGGESFTCDFEGDGEAGAAEVRVYATSLALIAREQTPFSVPFGEVRSISFDDARYAIDLETGAGRLSLLRLGKRSEPCRRLIESRLAELRKRTAEALAFLVPGLPTLGARRLAQALPDGVPAQRAQLDAISPEVWPTLVESAVGDPKLREAFEALAALCPAEQIAAGIKETNARQDVEGEEEPEEPEQADAVGPKGAAHEEEPEEAQGGEAEENPMTGRVVWFLFPIISQERSKPGNAIAVEVASRQGRATYLFRIAPPEVYREASWEELQSLARDRIGSVSRALVALTFKREPIFLSDEKLRSERYARYRLAMRLSAPLKAARATFVGRAVHGTAWRKQLEQALARANS